MCDDCVCSVQSSSLEVQDWKNTMWPNSFKNPETLVGSDLSPTAPTTFL